MGEATDGLRAVNEVYQQQKAERRFQALEDFHEVAAVAKDAGLELIRHTEAHYKLRTPWGDYELYPGKRRIYKNPADRIPRLELSGEWSLMAVVQSAIRMAAERP